MKKSMLLALAISASLFSSSTFATWGDCEVVRTWWGGYKLECSYNKDPGPGDTGGATSVPEIDGAGAGIAFALVGGLVLAYRERRLAKKSK
ncbi:MAG: hypothetical protein CMK89_08970 [Pseudomonadales bacterium]|nr:hypothetical protein [Pseudomonadales bacterium]